MSLQPQIDEAEFVILGAGMAGASLAYELASRGREVVVLETESVPGRHATGRSAAMFMESYGNTTVRALTCESREFFEQPPPGFCQTPLLERRGVLLVGAKEHKDKFAQAMLGTHCWEEVTLAEALRLVPVLSPQWITCAAYYSGAADLDVSQLMQGYLKGARDVGARIYCGLGSVQIKRSANHWKYETGRGSFGGRILINAAGAWADTVAAAAGVAPFGLQTLRRTAITINAPPDEDPRLWPMAMAADESFYFKPEGGRLLLSPANEDLDVPCDAAPDEMDVAIAVDRFERATDIQVLKVESKWAGLRTFTEDRSPVVGYETNGGDFFWFAGQGGYGIQIAPALARLGASLATGERLPADQVSLASAVLPSRARLNPRTPSGR